MSVKVIKNSDEENIIATIEPEKIRDLYYMIRETRLRLIKIEQIMNEITDGLGIDV